MEEHVFGVPTNLVHERDVGQIDLFKVEELLGSSRNQVVWGSSVLAAEVGGSTETSWIRQQNLCFGCRNINSTFVRF